MVNADDNYTPLNLKQRDPIILKTDEVQEHVGEWAAKQLHGRFYSDLQRDDVNKRASLEWLVKGNIYTETEGFMMAIQDNVINTRNHRKYILNETLDTDLCRMCNPASETVEHILSSCPTLAGNKYLERHNRIATIVYLEIAKLYNIKVNDNEPYYKYKPPPVVENENVKIYWDKTIITDIKIEHNRPDIKIILPKIKKKSY